MCTKNKFTVTKIYDYITPFPYTPSPQKKNYLERLACSSRTLTFVGSFKSILSQGFASAVVIAHEPPL